MVSNNTIVETLGRLAYLYGITSEVVYNIQSLKEGRNIIEYVKLNGWDKFRPILSAYEHIRANYRL
jgi:hypothetical protein